MRSVSLMILIGLLASCSSIPRHCSPVGSETIVLPSDELRASIYVSRQAPIVNDKQACWYLDPDGKMRIEDDSYGLEAVKTDYGWSVMKEWIILQHKYRTQN